MHHNRPWCDLSYVHACRIDFECFSQMRNELVPLLFSELLQCYVFQRDPKLNEVSKIALFLVPLGLLLVFFVHTQELGIVTFVCLIQVEMTLV